MSDTNLVISLSKDRRSRLGFGVGCLLGLLFVSADSASAQVVQVAGENPGALLGTPAQLVASEPSRASSRRLLIQYPQTGEPSPSDQVKFGEDDNQKTIEEKSEGKETEYKRADDERPEEKLGINNSTKTDDGKGITPVQSAELKLNVERVNISTDPIGTGILPEDTAAKRALPPKSLLDGQSRGIAVMHVNWRPASICHLPLYFEDAMLERHGHVRWGCVQPLASGAKFLATIPLLPYIATLQPKFEPRYTLGHFRPGSCAPALKDRLPWDQRAAVVETVSLGAFFWAAPL